MQIRKIKLDGIAKLDLLMKGSFSKKIEKSALQKDSQKPTCGIYGNNLL